MPNPKVNPTVLLAPIDSGYIAYDPISDRLHELNPFGALIAELCDGRRSVDDIREMVGPLILGGKVGEIDRWISEGFEAGLLVWSVDATASHREMSADELNDLIKRLRGEGKIQTAFLCAKRITELTPGDSDAWYFQGDLAQRAGHRDEARIAYEKYLKLEPDDAEIPHLLIALSDGEPPPRCSNEYIMRIFRTFSQKYDSLMIEDLDYQAPMHVQNLIASVLGEAKGLKILDLGCETGLSGAGLKDRAAELVGVDLSPEIAEVARAQGIYDRLEIAEITEWLDRTKENFDLIASCDSLIYFGDLHRVVSAAAKRLNPGGWFAFTIERSENHPFQLTDSGRYSHHRGHVREAATEAGLTVVRLEEGFLRSDAGSR
jgi:predicted TPR repeat methyltransferase